VAAASRTGVHALEASPHRRARSQPSLERPQADAIDSSEGTRPVSRCQGGALLSTLVLLHGAVTLEDLRIPPGNRLEKLRGERMGQYSLRINDQYRICFEWRDGDAY
jgi:hypothetical protein